MPRRGDIGVAPGVALNALVWETGTHDAPPFLLVHGLASNARMWEAVGNRLAEAGHAAAAVDLRGHGLSSKPSDGYDLATAVDDLIAVIAALGFDRPIAAGQSWGGNVVLELASKHPETPTGIAGVDGGTIDLPARFADWDACAAALTPPRTEGMGVDQITTTLRRLHPDWPDDAIAAVLSNFELRSDGTVAPWLTVDRHLMILRDLWENRPGERYPTIDAPVLLIRAESQSEWAAGQRAAVAAATAALPRSRVQWIEGDHDLHVQHPDAVAGLLLDAVADGFFA